MAATRARRSARWGRLALAALTALVHVGERLDPPPPPARVGGAWIGLTVGWRFGGG